MSDMRTPYSRVHGLGSARSGSGHFILQRVTAVANVFLAIFLIASVVALTGSDYETVRAYLANPLVVILVLAFIISGILHMRAGMQVIIEDYVTGESAKFLSLIGNTFFSFLIGLACVFAALKIGFGA